MTGLSFGSLKDEWRENQRLRLGAWLVGAILLFYSFLLLSDAQKTLKKDYDLLAERLQRLEALSQGEKWLERAEVVKAQKEQIESKLWSAKTRGLAQAEVQAWVDSVVQKLQFDKHRTQVEDALDVEGMENIWQVAATIEAPFNPRKYLDLLQAIETNPRLVSIEQVNILQRGHYPRFTLVLKAYVKARTS